MWYIITSPKSSTEAPIPCRKTCPHRFSERSLHQTTNGFLFPVKLLNFGITVYPRGRVANDKLARAQNHHLIFKFSADLNGALILDSCWSSTRGQQSLVEPSRIKPHGAVSFAGSDSQPRISATHSNGLHAWLNLIGLFTESQYHKDPGKLLAKLYYWNSDDCVKYSTEAQSESMTCDDQQCTDPPDNSAKISPI